VNRAEQIGSRGPRAERSRASVCRLALRSQASDEFLRRVAGAVERSGRRCCCFVEALNATEDTSGSTGRGATRSKAIPKAPQAHMAVAQQLARLGKYPGKRDRVRRDS